ncbi:MAG: GMP synthase [Gammaproteobacteria bacterium]|nr:GMP synthase [Gammaproteobacteria bacterium]
MKNFAVIQHNYSEFLGQIERQLEVRDIGFSYFRPFVGQDIPGSALHYDALFLLGGSSPAADKEKSPWVENELNLIQRFLDSKRPVVGLGFGATVVAAKFGATLSAEPEHTAYWTTAHSTDAGKDDPLAEAMNGRRVLVMYNGGVRLPDDLSPVLVDDNGNWLAVRPSELCYAILFRPELKPGMLEDMVMEADRSTPENIGELLSQARDEWVESQKTTDEFIIALVKTLDLMQDRKKAPIFSLKVE